MAKYLVVTRYIWPLYGKRVVRTHTWRESGEASVGDTLNQTERSARWMSRLAALRDKVPTDQAAHVIIVATQCDTGGAMPFVALSWEVMIYGRSSSDDSHGTVSVLGLRYKRPPTPPGVVAAVWSWN